MHIAPPALRRTGSWTAELMAAKLPLPAVLYLIAVMLPVGFQLGPLYLTLLRILLLVMIIPLTAQLFAGKFGRVIWTDTLFFLYIAWTTIALAHNNPEMVVNNTGAAAIEFLGGYVVARATIRSRSDFVALCRWLAVLIALTIPLAIYESLTDNPVIIRTLRSIPGIRTVGDVQYERRMGLYRAQVFLAHPIHYGLFASTVLSLAYVGLKGAVSPVARLVLSGLVVLAVLLSLSSGALLPMAVQIALIAWAWLLRNQAKRWWIFVGLVALAWITVDLLSNRSPLTVLLHYATFSAHNATWRMLTFEYGMQNVWGSPIFGIGFKEWFRPYFMHTSSVDNFWLLNAMRYGIPGFLLIATGFGIGLVRVIFRDFRGDAELSRLRLAWVFTFVSLTLTLCTVHVWTTVFSYTFFLYGAGMWFIQAQPASAAQEAPEAAGTALRRAPRARVRAGDAIPPKRADASKPAPAPQALAPEERLGAAARGPTGERAASADAPPPAAPAAAASDRQPRYSRFPTVHRRTR